MQKTRSQFLLGAAVAGIVGASLTMGASRARADEAAAPAPAKKAAKEVSCYGGNECGGKGACKTALNECAGKNSCKGKAMMKMTKADCKKAHGSMKPFKAPKKAEPAKS